MKPRDYQDAAVAATLNYFTHSRGNPLVCMPTGTGKSVVIAETIRRMLHRWASTRIVKATHVKELVAQNAEKLLAMWPGAPLGVVAAGLDRYEFGLPITFGSVQTLVNYIDQLGAVHILLVDEAHMVGPKESSMYQQLITGLKQKNPLLKVVGYTATDFRIGQGKLASEEGGIFTDVCFDMCSRQAFKWLFDQGYLCRLEPKRTGSEINVEGIKTTGGDYNQHELEERAMSITERAIDEAIVMGEGREKWLVFASGVKHAEEVTALLNLRGISARCVHSKMKGKQRDDNIADFKAGKYTALVNNGVLTTGFDDPGIDFIVMLRATQSASLWVQMLGRGTRPLFDTLFKHWYMPGVRIPVIQVDGKWHYDLSTQAGRLAAIATSRKRVCLVADFGGNTKRLGPINDPVVPRKKGKGKKGVAPVRLCDHCGSYNHASATECEFCGAQFPRQPKIFTEADQRELIATDDPVVEDFDVSNVDYKVSRKPGRPDTLEVTYWSKMRMFREHVCLEHAGTIRHKAVRWWRERTGVEAPPTIGEAMLHIQTLKTPNRIRVWVNKRYPEIISHEFETTPGQPA